MSKKPQRTWALVASLGVPLTIVGAAAMAISYATLIDVARVNGLPLPELFPVLIDVGTVTCMIAAAQFRIHGTKGRWLAYTTFILLSGVSIVANASHAGRAADLTVTTSWAAALLAATPPATLLAITHLVMMLIPDEKERAKLAAQRERAEQETRRREPIPKPQPRPTAEVPAAVALHADRHAMLRPVEQSVDEPPALQLSDDDVRARVLAYLEAEGKRPSGREVGEWLGKTSKTGQRFLKKMEDDGLLIDSTEQRPVSELLELAR